MHNKQPNHFYRNIIYQTVLNQSTETIHQRNDNEIPTKVHDNH